MRDNTQNLGYLQRVTVCDNAFNTQHAGHTHNIEENCMIFLIKWFCLDLSKYIYYNALY